MSKSCTIFRLGTLILLAASPAHAQQAGKVFRVGF